MNLATVRYEGRNFAARVEDDRAELLDRAQKTPAQLPDHVRLAATFEQLAEVVGSRVMKRHGPVGQAADELLDDLRRVAGELLGRTARRDPAVA